MHASRRFTLAVTAILALWAMPSWGNVIQLLDTASCGGCANILFQIDDIGNPLTAGTQGGSVILLSQDSLYGNLFAPSSGQASVEQDLGLDFYGLHMDLSQTTTTLFEFTIAPLTGPDAAAGDPAERARVTFVDNSGATFVFDLGSVGANRHIWQAIDGQTIVSVNIEFLGGTVHAVEQIRLAEGGVVEPAEVPEPATMLMIGSGLLGISFIGRKLAKSHDASRQNT